MEVIFLLGVAQAFFLSFLIVSKKRKSTGDYILGSWMAFIGLHLLNYYFHSTGFLMKHPHLLGIGFCFPMLQGPFMFVYVLVMTNKTSRFKPAYWLHTLPFLLFTIYFLFDFYFLSGPEKVAYYQSQSTNPNPVIKAGGFLNVFLGPAYVIWSLFKLRRHTKNISEQFSYTERINLNWLKYVLAGLGFVWVTVLAVSTLSDFYPLILVEWGDHSIYLALTVAVFFLGFFGLKQKSIYVNMPDSGKMREVVASKIEKKQKEKERYKHSGLKENEAKEHLKLLLQYMQNEKPYLNGKLSLKEVAEYLDVSTNHLSQITNEQLGKNFFDFVNSYRVEEVKSRLSDPESEQFTLLAIAYDSGFNSKSSFNSIFKKFTSLTPSQYMKAKTG
ncbi:MAG: hypothetical protein COA57_02825 [Flavobacteriales bacterium]|nr:helix-turn-helix transcriptional regulator [Bacteroidales bacterium AH-315-I05]PCJ89050.1 MAG: hypothetical protein COA57_02825 [Flavobacteriales bacterium]